MRKNNQTGRILPKCGADKKVFLNAVYKKHTQVKKHRLDVSQFGRSMVEMLGVLAIIGVLSVGAIAGYQKAMMKYKMNKHKLLLNLLLNNAIIHSSKFSSSNEYVDANGKKWFSNAFYKAGFAPDGVYTKSNNPNFLYDNFNNQIWLFYSPGYSQYGMGYTFTNTLSIKELCINYIDVIKENSSQFQYFYIDQSVDSEKLFSEYLYGDKYCNKNVKCIKDITVSDIYNICELNNNSTQTRSYVTWK